MSPATLIHDLDVPSRLSTTAEESARETAAAVVAVYLRRLGFKADSRTLLTAPHDVARTAADMLPPLRRSDESAVRQAAISHAVENLDHWLRRLQAESGLAAAPTATRMAAEIETGRRRSLPAERNRKMTPQRFRSRLGLVARRCLRAVGSVVSGSQIGRQPARS